ncbi:hypothetical protein PRIPAC_75109 [Pristionchus pacificus]|uniref:Peptidase n=1 Tax=Pristionchus pacificus TaxID=54126 RepID=A0A2A6B4P3_PRIPA|nr:hypothetical protein PRIPAC_75109 [Pristionchus pacificus]|eukprot:PDM60849.1 Peptidase [Pristionchus pacificus]
MSDKSQASVKRRSRKKGDSSPSAGLSSKSKKVKRVDKSSRVKNKRHGKAGSTPAKSPSKEIAVPDVKIEDKEKTSKGLKKADPEVLKAIKEGRENFFHTVRRGTKAINFTFPPGRIYKIGTDPKTVPIVPTSKMKDEMRGMKERAMKKKETRQRKYSAEKIANSTASRETTGADKSSASRKKSRHYRPFVDTARLPPVPLLPSPVSPSSRPPPASPSSYRPLSLPVDCASAASSFLTGNGDNLVNPTYSSTNISTASESVSVTPIVDIELVPFTKRILSEPKQIKMFILSLLGLVAALLLLNVIFITLWASSTSSQTAPIHQTSELVNETAVSSEIPVTTTVDLPTEITPPSTISSPLPRVSDETMNYEYAYFTRRFNRSKTDAGRRNYAENFAFFTVNKEGMNVTETQFADLSLDNLKKIVNNNRDSSRSNERFNCIKFTTSASTHAKDLHNKSRIPSRTDLRRNARMPKVRNQGITCNSGYAFAATALVDYFETKSLSVLYLLCDNHNFHCEGGEVFRAMQTIDSSGILEESLLPYSENSKWCSISHNKTTNYASPCFASGFTHTPIDQKDYFVRTNDFISLIIATYSPAIIEVPVDRSFFFYKNGIYRPNCAEIIGYQPAIVVGYDKKDGIDFWILRNSFGTDWGMDDDFHMEKGVTYEDANCDAFAYAIY